MANGIRVRSAASWTSQAARIGYVRIGATPPQTKLKLDLSAAKPINVTCTVSDHLCLREAHRPDWDDGGRAANSTDNTLP